METTEIKKVEIKKCGCPCHKAVGFFILLIGIAMLLGQLNVINSWIEMVAVSCLIILIGLKKLFAGGCNCCDRT